MKGGSIKGGREGTPLLVNKRAVHILLGCFLVNQIFLVFLNWIIDRNFSSPALLSIIEKAGCDL